MARTQTLLDEPGGMTDRPDGTVAFYDADPEGYASSTLGRDVSALYRPFLDLVPAGGLILDAGCGAGRDIREFITRGFRVEAFDASRGLAAVATRLTGLSVDVTRFEGWRSGGKRYDGIWCFASLLHVARADLPDVLGRLAASLRPGAPLFASFKCGEDETVDRKGRRYTNLTEEEASALVASVPVLDIVKVWSEDGPSALDDRTRWVYVLANRRS